MDTKLLVAANQKRWDSAVFSKSAQNQAASVASRLYEGKERFQNMEAKTGVPWYIIAVIKEREAGADPKWTKNIAQGDPWARKSTHVPAGRGPFASWEDAAYDALLNCAPKAGKWKDWTPGGALTILEMYNGMGYENNHHMASPYIWAGSNAYVKGKYVSDGKFDSMAVDHQLGCAVMLKALMDLDDSVFAPAKAKPAKPEPKPEVKPEPVVEKEPSPAEPEVEPAGPADVDPEDEKTVHPKTIWYSIGTALSAVGGFLTDWKVIAVVGVIVLVGFIVWEHSGKPKLKDLL